MASVRTLVRIKRGGEYHPAGTELHGLSDEEADALHPHAERLPDDIAEPEAVAITVVEPVVPDAPETIITEDDAGSRIEQIRDSIDLLDESDFARDGKPKILALVGVLGFRPTPAEIKTALELRAEMGLDNAR